MTETVITDRYQTLLDANRNFLEDRPVMKEHNHSSLITVLRLLANEVDEAIETVESGDAIIEDKHVAIEQELADIGHFLFTAFEVLGSDFFKAMMEKHMRNMLKYPAYLFQDGDYQEKITRAKQEWSNSDGNHEFYNGYSRHMIDFDARELAQESV